MKSDNDSILATKYQQKTDKQHILDNPDTYMWVLLNMLNLKCGL